MLRILLFLFVAVELLAHAIPALALELTHRIPESVKRLEVRMEHTPSYQEVYGRYEKRVPLREWLFENEATTVFGTVSRSETRIHFDYDWGWTDDWTVSVSSAVVHKSQTANLSGGSGLELPESGSVTGLGDTTISLRKELFASTTWFSVGGMQLVLPTGTAGQAIGHSPNAIGERQTDVGGFFRFTWYPLAPGWRNGLGLQILSQLKGARKNYQGERVIYYPGNKNEVYYNWSYEEENRLFRRRTEADRAGTHHPWHIPAQSPARGSRNAGGWIRKPLRLGKAPATVAVAVSAQLEQVPASASCSRRSNSGPHVDSVSLISAKPHEFPAHPT